MHLYAPVDLKIGNCRLIVAMQSWDLIVTFTDKSYRAVQGTASRTGAEVELWNVDDPSVYEGNCNQRLEYYRSTRDDIEKQIKERFEI